MVSRRERHLQDDYENRDGRPGYCWCGCGRRTSIAEKTSARHGHVRGKPVAFLKGHHRRKSGADYVEVDNGYGTPCRVWQLSLAHGYPNMHLPDGSTVRVARYLYEKRHGPGSAKGRDVHAACGIRACVNGDHLVAATRSELRRAEGRSRLSPGEVREMRRLRIQEGLTQGEIGERFGVVQTWVSKILRNEALPDPAYKPPSEVLGPRTNRVQARCKVCGARFERPANRDYQVLCGKPECRLEARRAASRGRQHGEEAREKISRKAKERHARTGGIPASTRARIAAAAGPTEVQRAVGEAGLPERKPPYLAEMEWEALVLHAREGLSYAEIARQWGSSSRKARYKATKALNLIRTCGPPERDIPEPYEPQRGVYGRIGVLDTDGATAQCHVCGRRFAHLGNHVKRAHGMEADDYKKEFGLKLTTGLISPDLADARRDTSHLRPYGEHSAAELRLLSPEERSARMRGRKVSEEQRRDPVWQDVMQRNISAALEAVRLKREAGEYKEREGLPEGAGEKGRAILAELRRKNPNYDKEIGRKVSEAKGGVKKETRFCAVCDRPFEHVAARYRLTCSDACSKELRRCQMADRAPSKRPEVRKIISEKARERSKNRNRDARGRFVRIPPTSEYP